MELYSSQKWNGNLIAEIQLFKCIQCSKCPLTSLPSCKVHLHTSRSKTWPFFFIKLVNRYRPLYNQKGIGGQSVDITAIQIKSPENVPTIQSNTTITLLLFSLGLFILLTLWSLVGEPRNANCCFVWFILNRTELNRTIPSEMAESVSLLFCYFQFFLVGF